MNIPQGWEVRSRIDLLEPRQKLELPLAGQDAQARPRANVIIVRRHDPQTSVELESETLLDSLKGNLRDFRLLAQEPFVFEDGSRGSALTLRFETPSGSRLLQHHAFRLDGTILSQLTTTVALQDESRLSELIQSVIQGYQPG